MLQRHVKLRAVLWRSNVKKKKKERGTRFGRISCESRATNALFSLRKDLDVNFATVRYLQPRHFAALTATACHRWTLPCSATTGRWQKCWLRSARRKGTNVSTIESNYKLGAPHSANFVTPMTNPIDPHFPRDSLFRFPTNNPSLLSLFLSLFVAQKIQGNRRSTGDSN